MSDDIVTRLREKFQGQMPICLEAADEIERLQTELQMAVKWRDNYKLAFERCQGKETPNE